MTAKEKLPKGARLLVAAMERHGVTAEQVAAKAYLSEATVRAAKGGVRISQSSALRLSAAVEALTGKAIAARLFREVGR